MTRASHRAHRRDLGTAISGPASTPIGDTDDCSYTSPVRLTDLRDPVRPGRHSRASTRNIERMQVAAVGARPAAAAAREDAQERRASRGCRSRAARSASAARSSARRRSSPTPASTDIRLPYPLNPVNADRVLALLDRVAPLVHRRRSGRRARLVARDAARGRDGRRPGQGRRRLPSLRHRSRSRRRAPASSRAIAALPGLRFRGLLSHAGHGYGATSETRSWRRSPAREAQTLTRSRGGRDRASRCDGDQRRRDADRALQRRQERHHRAAARQLRLLRPHAGRRSAPRRGTTAR